MLISIITINLNNCDGLKKTISSVIIQKKINIEFIVIDGGSTDGSVELIKDSSNQIDYWISEPDNGIYHAMNKGIIKSNKEYCLFLNSGDYLVENLFDKLELLNFNDDIVYGNVIFNYKNGLRERDTGAGKSQLTFYDFVLGSSIRHQGALIRTALFKLYGLYNESYRIISDWVFFMDVIIFKEATVKYVNIDIAYFDPYGISSVNHQNYSVETELALKRILPKNVLIDFFKMKLLIEENEKLNNELKRYKNRFYILDKLLSNLKKFYR